MAAREGERAEVPEAAAECLQPRSEDQCPPTGGDKQAQRGMLKRLTGAGLSKPISVGISRGNAHCRLLILPKKIPLPNTVNYCCECPLLL